MPSPPDVASFAYLWDGSAPEWCVQVTSWYEGRIVLLFDPPGPTVRDAAAVREVLEPFRARPAHAVWGKIKGHARVALSETYTRSEARSLVRAARARGLRVEELGTNFVQRIPFNMKASSALVIDDDERARRVVQCMLSAGVPCMHVEVD